MMKEFLLFFLLANVNFALLTAGYYFLLRKQTNYKLNRMLLLVIGFLPFLLPFFNSSFESQPLLPESFLNTITVSAGKVDSTFSLSVFSSSLGIYDVISGILITGMVFFFIQNLIILLVLFIRIGKCEKENFRNHILVKNCQLASTASFFRYLLCNNTQPDKYELKHELVHINEKHSYDVIFATILQAFCWCNPFVYLYKRMIVDNHEFRADEVCKKHFGLKEYSKKLFENIFTPIESKYIHNFSIALLTKTRITMMNKNQKTNRLSFTRYAMMAPLTVMTIFIGSSTAQVKNEVPVKDTPSEIYTIVEEMPVYKGGEKALFAYLSENIKYPEKAKTDSIEGLVYVNFVVNDKGRVTDAKILRGVHPELDREALSVIQKMPDWKPGKQEGKEVNVLYNLPIQFKLRSE